MDFLFMGLRLFSLYRTGGAFLSSSDDRETLVLIRLPMFLAAEPMREIRPASGDGAGASSSVADDTDVFGELTGLVIEPSQWSSRG